MSAAPALPPAWDLVDGYEKVEAALELCESDEEAMAILKEALQETTFNIHIKHENFCRLFSHYQAKAGMCKGEKQKWADKQKRLESRAEWCKQIAKFLLEFMGQKKIEAGPFDISLCQNSVAGVEVLDKSLVPAKYFKEPELDLRAIADDLKAGNEIPGARLGERGSHVRIG